MGIYDRDYYRDGSGGNPFDHRMHACIALVCLYVGVFIVQIGTREQVRGERQFRPGPVTEAIELKASKVLDGEVWRLATYAFAHDPMLVPPIIINILFLIWVGRHVEDIYGWKEFLTFYLFAGLLAGVAFVGVAAIADQDGVLMGPGGSVTAALFLFALHYPKRTIFNTVPIWFVIAFYVANDVLGFLGGRMHPAAFAAHAAAAAFAFVYHTYSLRVSTWLPGLPSRGARKQRPKPKLAIYRDEPAEEETSAPASAPSSVPGTAPATASAPATQTSGTATQSAMDEHLEAKLDEVLEKVKKHGQESLTEEERAVLFRASEIYRKRRKMGGS